MSENSVQEIHFLKNREREIKYGQTRERGITHQTHKTHVYHVNFIHCKEVVKTTYHGPSTLFLSCDISILWEMNDENAK